MLHEFLGLPLAFSLLDYPRQFATHHARFSILMAKPKSAAAATPVVWHVVRRSSIHSQGVFALRDIPPGTRILEYTGEKIGKRESERRANERLARAKVTGEAAVYIFNLNKRQDLDGSMKSNIARLLNHSCDPNCEAIQSRGRIWMTAMRDIRKGEELTFNYGFDLENWSEHPCRCGTDRCIGFIAGEEYWGELKTILEDRAAIVRAKKKTEASAAKKTSAKKKKR